MNFANFLKISEKKSSLNDSELVFQRFRVLDYPPKMLFDNLKIKEGIIK